MYHVQDPGIIYLGVRIQPMAPSNIDWKIRSHWEGAGTPPWKQEFRFMQDSSASLIQSETFFVMGSAVPASVQPLGIHCRDILENEWATMLSPALCITASAPSDPSNRASLDKWRTIHSMESVSREREGRGWDRPMWAGAEESSGQNQVQDVVWVMFLSVKMKGRNTCVSRISEYPWKRKKTVCPSLEGDWEVGGMK